MINIRENQHGHKFIKNIENNLKVKDAEGIFNTMDEAKTFVIHLLFVENNISFDKIESLNSRIEND